MKAIPWDAVRPLTSREPRHEQPRIPTSPTALRVSVGPVSVIAGLASRDDTAGNGRFQRDNRAVLDEIRDGDRDAWSSVQLRLGERDRELRDQRNE